MAKYTRTIPKYIYSNSAHVNCHPVYAMAEFKLHFAEHKKACFIPTVLQNSPCSSC